MSFIKEKLSHKTLVNQYAKQTDQHRLKGYCHSAYRCLAFNKAMCSSLASYFIIPVKLNEAYRTRGSHTAAL